MIPTQDSLFAAVLVEVWDHDFLGDDFLGLVAIDPAELITAAETGGLVTRRLLDKDEKGRKKRQAHGTLSFKVEQSVAICNLRRRLCKKVMSARDCGVPLFVSRHRRASSRSEKALGGFFSDFE